MSKKARILLVAVVVLGAVGASAWGVASASGAFAVKKMVATASSDGSAEDPAQQGSQMLPTAASPVSSPSDGETPHPESTESDEGADGEFDDDDAIEYAEKAPVRSPESPDVSGHDDEEEASDDSSEDSDDDDDGYSYSRSRGGRSSGGGGSSDSSSSASSASGSSESSSHHSAGHDSQEDDEGDDD